MSPPPWRSPGEAADRRGQRQRRLSSAPTPPAAATSKAASALRARDPRHQGIRRKSSTSPSARSPERFYQEGTKPWQLPPPSSTWTGWSRSMTTSWSRRTCGSTASRLRDRDRAPHIEVGDNGMDFWVYDGKRFPALRPSVPSPGKSKEEFSPEPLPYSEMRPGCYDGGAASRSMDRAGILASLCFPTVPRFCGQPVLRGPVTTSSASPCLRAYNDWMIDEWSGSAPGRYIPLVLIPPGDPVLAATELERCAAKGAATFAFSSRTRHRLGLPTIHDPGPLLGSASSPPPTSCGMVASMHVNSSSQVPKIAPGLPRSWPISPGARCGPPERCCRGSSAAGVPERVPGT